ncbi:hypothetical protein D3C78_1057660 [compost metagenome]
MVYFYKGYAKGSTLSHIFCSLYDLYRLHADSYDSFPNRGAVHFESDSGFDDDDDDSFDWLLFY